MCLADFVTHSPRGPSSERRREVRDTCGGFKPQKSEFAHPVQQNCSVVGAAASVSEGSSAAVGRAREDFCAVRAMSTLLRQVLCKDRNTGGVSPLVVVSAVVNRRGERDVAQSLPKRRPGKYPRDGLSRHFSEGPFTQKETRNSHPSSCAAAHHTSCRTPTRRSSSSPAPRARRAAPLFASS